MAKQPHRTMYPATMEMDSSPAVIWEISVLLEGGASALRQAWLT